MSGSMRRMYESELALLDERLVECERLAALKKHAVENEDFVEAQRVKHLLADLDADSIMARREEVRQKLDVPSGDAVRARIHELHGQLQEVIHLENAKQAAVAQEDFVAAADAKQRLAQLPGRMDLERELSQAQMELNMVEGTVPAAARHPAPVIGGLSTEALVSPQRGHPMAPQADATVRHSYEAHVGPIPAAQQAPIQAPPQPSTAAVTENDGRSEKDPRIVWFYFPQAVTKEQLHEAIPDATMVSLNLRGTATARFTTPAARDTFLDSLRNSSMTAPTPDRRHMRVKRSGGPTAWIGNVFYHVDTNLFKDVSQRIGPIVSYYPSHDMRCVRVVFTEPQFAYKALVEFGVGKHVQVLRSPPPGFTSQNCDARFFSTVIEPGDADEWEFPLNRPDEYTPELPPGSIDKGTVWVLLLADSGDDELKKAAGEGALAVHKRRFDGAYIVFDTLEHRDQVLARKRITLPSGRSVAVEEANLSNQLNVFVPNLLSRNDKPFWQNVVEKHGKIDTISTDENCSVAQIKFHYYEDAESILRDKALAVGMPALSKPIPGKECNVTVKLSERAMDRVVQDKKDRERAERKAAKAAKSGDVTVVGGRSGRSRSRSDSPRRGRRDDRDRGARGERSITPKRRRSTSRSDGRRPRGGSRSRSPRRSGRGGSRSPRRSGRDGSPGRRRRSRTPLGRRSGGRRSRSPPRRRFSRSPPRDSGRRDRSPPRDGRGGGGFPPRNRDSPGRRDNRDGDRGGGGGRSGPPVCRDFAQGHCNFGNNCRFMHTTRSQSPPRKRRDRSPERRRRSRSPPQHSNNVEI